VSCEMREMSAAVSNVKSTTAPALEQNNGTVLRLPKLFSLDTAFILALMTLTNVLPGW